MQILQWLFRGAHEEYAGETSSSPNTKKNETASDETAKLKHIVLFKHQENESTQKNSSSCTAVLFRRDRAKAFFYSTLSLKRLGSIRRRQHCWIHSMKMKKEDLAPGLGIANKSDSAVHVGNKVLPISEMALSSATTTNDQCGLLEKKEKLKGNKTKATSRMKELLRWAAAAKSEKAGKYLGRKVLHFRNRGTLKEVPDDDQLSSDSPKISFRWEVESCSTTSSVYSALSMASSSKHDPVQDKDHCTPRTGNWITTDSEFVVLEL